MKINFRKNNRLLVLLRSTENGNDTDKKSHAKSIDVIWRQYFFWVENFKYF